MGEGRDLGHVGDRDHLVAVAEERHLASDRDGDLAAHVRVDLVEDHQGMRSWSARALFTASMTRDISRSRRR